MLNERVENALNKQVNAELYSSYLYLSMAAWFGSRNLVGFVNWMKIQALEELYHAMKIYSFIDERGGRITLEAVENPPAEWSSPEAVFEAVLGHEQKVTALINDLVTLSLEEKDHASNNFLQWFVAEQVEEESSADEILQKIKLAGNEGSGLFMIDQELAQRALTVPADIKLNITTQAK